MRYSSFAEASLDEGAFALNAVFEGYLIPVAFSPEHLKLHMHYNDVVPSLSPIWLDDNGDVVAAALLAVRGKRGWIGGFGVAPRFRGHGFAKALVDSLFEIGRGRGLESITLEVLRENTPALNLYRSSGFAVTRGLCSFETFVESSGLPKPFIYASPDELVDLPDRAAPCWQRERASLLSGSVSAAVSDRAGTYALFRYNASLVQVLKFDARGVQTLSALARAIAFETAPRVLVLNEPEESALVDFAREAGWSDRYSQFEMQVQLDE